MLYLAVGAITGAYLRYKIGSEAVYIYGIPVTILLINVLGSFALGLSMTTVQKFGLNQGYVVPTRDWILRVVHDNVIIRF